MRRLLVVILGIHCGARTFAGDDPSSCYERANRVQIICVTPAGKLLAAKLDKMDVEHQWLRSDLRIDWRTGAPIGEQEGTPLREDETHCSAFAAAVAERFGIYLLHPPEHALELLANAQFEWLAGVGGRNVGWRPVGSAVESQCLSNQGELVVAVFENPDVRRSGHVAIVRPETKSIALITLHGPQVMQAGFINYRSTDLATGFARHNGAWIPHRSSAVRFFSHSLSDARPLIACRRFLTGYDRCRTRFTTIRANGRCGASTN